MELVLYVLVHRRSKELYALDLVQPDNFTMKMELVLRRVVMKASIHTRSMETNSVNLLVLRKIITTTSQKPVFLSALTLWTLYP